MPLSIKTTSYNCIRKINKYKCKHQQEICMNKINSYLPEYQTVSLKKNDTQLTINEVHPEFTLLNFTLS